MKSFLIAVLSLLILMSLSEATKAQSATASAGVAYQANVVVQGR